MEKCNHSNAKKFGKTKVQISTTTFAKRRCTRVELTHPSSAGGKLLHYRNVVYFDQETGLPIRAESYDWPETPREAPPLAEVYSYVNLVLNPGLGDEVFDH